MSPSGQYCPSMAAQTLGYGGLIPFLGLAMSVWLLPVSHQAWAAKALLAYSAAIASFLGAIHWGLAMQDNKCQNTGLLLWGVIPSLLAWVALLLPLASGLLLVAALLWACFGVDRVVYTRFGLRAWIPMRLVLTLVASLSCIAGALQWVGFAA